MSLVSRRSLAPQGMKGSVGLVLDSGVGDVRVGVGEWSCGSAAGLEAVGLGPDLRAGYRSWVPFRGRRGCGVDFDLPRPGAPLRQELAVGFAHGRDSAPRRPVARSVGPMAPIAH